MVDTLTLHLIPDKWSLGKQPDINVQEVSYNIRSVAMGKVPERHIICFHGKKPIIGTKAYHNEKDGLVGATIRNEHLYINFSVPRIAAKGKGNMDPVNQKVAKESIDLVAGYFKKKDIIFEPKNATLSRIDLFKNLKMNMPYPFYKDIFGLMSMSREKKHINFPESYLTGNNTTQINFYDKVKAMSDIYGIDTGEKNIMRAELRYLKGKATVDQAGIIDYPDLLEKWDSLNEIYIDQMKKKLFTKTNTENISKKMIKNEQDLLEYLSRKEGYGLQTYIRLTGYAAIAAKWGSHRIFKESAMKFYSERTVYRLMRKIKLEINDVADNMELDIESGETNLFQLYTEIKEKVLAA